MQSSMDHFQAGYQQQLPASASGPALTTLQLFTPVITQEFHPQGQKLSMNRQLGYTPGDTDMIR
ncbi:MAG: DinB family protein [Candidatus Pseudobacter hemicellulosilyticus]|uniref:DinB family protein n=1 Tax=Candidatus Pseudobacter hemicellulosilyticus TaxID=3121375 RepID=A0AAJ5WUQ5_9BACT|nr:MAG: DinB family protein [Pseudobacter sp.]